MSQQIPIKGDLVFFTKTGIEHSSAGAMPSFITTDTPLLVLEFKLLPLEEEDERGTWIFPWKNRWGLKCLVDENIFYLMLHSKDIPLEDMIITVKASRKNGVQV